MLGRMTYEDGCRGLIRQKAGWVGNSNHQYSERKCPCRLVIQGVSFGEASPGRQMMWERNSISLPDRVSVWVHYSPSIQVPHPRLSTALHRDYSVISWVPWNPTSTAVSPWTYLLLPASAYLCHLGYKGANLLWIGGKLRHLWCDF